MLTSTRVPPALASTDTESIIDSDHWLTMSCDNNI